MYAVLGWVPQKKDTEREIMSRQFIEEALGAPVRDEANGIRQRLVVICKVIPSSSSLIEVRGLSSCTTLLHPLTSRHWVLASAREDITWGRQFLQLREISVFQK